MIIIKNILINIEIAVCEAIGALNRSGGTDSEKVKDVLSFLKIKYKYSDNLLTARNICKRKKGHYLITYNTSPNTQHGHIIFATSKGGKITTWNDDGVSKKRKKYHDLFDIESMVIFWKIYQLK